MDIKEEIKSRISIVELVSQYVELKKAGRNFRGLSPFTSEKSPSFFVSPEKEIAYCFSTNQGGDVFAFYQLVESCSFAEALKALGDKVGVDTSSISLSDAQKSSKNSDRLIELHDMANKFFVANLKHLQAKKFLDYLYSRGFDQKVVSQEEFGCCLDSFDSLCRFLLKKGFSDKEIIESGLGYLNKANKLQDRFRDRLMFPIRNAKGKLVAFAGRVLESNAKLAKYINSPETDIYKKNQLLYGFSTAKAEIRKRDQVILVEGYFDQIACKLNGFANTAAVSGTALTDNQLVLIKKFTKNIYFCLDMDDAGLRALDRGVRLALPLGFNLKVIVLEGVKDPDEAFNKSADLFPKAVENAFDYFEFLIQKFINDNTEAQRNDPLVLKNFVGLYLDVVKLVPEEFLKDFYIRKLSKVTGFSLSNLILELEKTKSIKISNQTLSKPVKKQKVSLEDLFWTYFFMSSKTHAQINSESSFLSESLEENELYKTFILNYNAIDFKQIEVPEKYLVLALDLESRGMDVNRFDFESEIIQLLNRMKQKYRQSRLSEIKRKLHNCNAQEQLQLLSQYKHLMSL